jgi:hypothetical protein
MTLSIVRRRNLGLERFRKNESRALASIGRLERDGKVKSFSKARDNAETLLA